MERMKEVILEIPASGMYYLALTEEGFSLCERRAGQYDVAIARSQTTKGFAHEAAQRFVAALATHPQPSASAESVAEQWEANPLRTIQELTILIQQYGDARAVERNAEIARIQANCQNWQDRLARKAARNAELMEALKARKLQYSEAVQMADHGGDEQQGRYWSGRLAEVTFVLNQLGHQGDGNGGRG